MSLLRASWRLNNLLDPEVVQDKNGHVSTLVRLFGGGKSPVDDDNVIIKGIPVCLVYDEDEDCKDANVAGCGQRYFQLESRVLRMVAERPSFLLSAA